MHDAENGAIWPAFGDLMACLVGLFVLFFCWMVVTEVSLAAELEIAEEGRVEAEARAAELERALAGPIESGLITLHDGRIGIRGSVLFDLSSAELRPGGQGLMTQLAAPLSMFLEEHDEALMISGFTDDLALREGGTFVDNWELSAERSLTVTRTLIDAGLPPDRLFAAGFGPHHPVDSNETEVGRRRNRRVEISPVPRPFFEHLTSGEGSKE